MAEVAQSMELEEHLPPATQEESQLAKQAMGVIYNFSSYLSCEL